MQQIEWLELDHASDFRRDLPHLANLREVLDQHQHRQPALHFELRIDAALGLFQDFGRQIGGDDLDPPTAQFLAHLLQAERERIRLLPGRGSRTPDADAAAVLARRQQCRQDGLTEMIERHLVAKEE